MKIQILGSGCRKCSELFCNVEKAVKANNIDCELEKVTDIEQITAMGVMITPALVIDGKVLSSGKVLTPEAVSEILLQNGGTSPAVSCCCQEKNADQSPCCCCEKKSGSFFKKIITILLLLFIAGSVLYIIERENKPAEKQAAESLSADPLPADVLKVYYFHGTQRCYKCSTIEKLTREAVGDYEKVEFISVNVEKPENEHFIKDFTLASRTVVMERNGKFEKFDRVWELVRTPEEFTAYIREGVERLSK